MEKCPTTATIRKVCFLSAYNFARNGEVTSKCIDFLYVIVCTLWCGAEHQLTGLSFHPELHDQNELKHELVWFRLKTELQLFFADGHFDLTLPIQIVHH